jgi:Heavy-metal resistance
MFGIIIGTLCLIALIGVVRGRSWRRGGGLHGGCGPWGYRPFRGCGPYDMGGGPRWMLRSLFYRLGTSPSQEKVILDAVGALRDQTGKLWGEWQQSRSELAEVLRGEALDEARIQGAFARHDGLIAQLRQVALDGIGKVHAVLDPEQRKRLASLLEHPHRYAGAWI